MITNAARRDVLRLVQAFQLALSNEEQGTFSPQVSGRAPFALLVYFFGGVCHVSVM